MKNVVVTGSNGYIGSAIVDELIKSGYRVFSIDMIRSRDMNYPDDQYTHYTKNLADKDILSWIVDEIKRWSKGAGFSVIHLASWKDLTESNKIPLDYYKNNIDSALTALEIAHQLNADKFIFSSSAAVYSDDSTGAIKESDPTDPPSPYGYSKLILERIISDCCSSFGIQSVSLRYQNPVGRIRGVTFDDSDSMFGNIFKSLRDNTEFTIFGGDYPTKDGTCIRDYISIQDIADIHLFFLERKELHKNEQLLVNAGTGVGYSCLEICKAVKKVYPSFNYKIGPAREGDSAGSYADTSALTGLGYKCKYSLLDIISGIGPDFCDSVPINHPSLVDYADTLKFKS